MPKMLALKMALGFGMYRWTVQRIKPAFMCSGTAEQSNVKILFRCNFLVIPSRCDARYCCPTLILQVVKHVSIGFV